MAIKRLEDAVDSDRVGAWSAAEDDDHPEVAQRSRSGKQLLADTRPDPVSADDHVSMSDGSVGEVQCVSTTDTGTASGTIVRIVEFLEPLEPLSPPGRLCRQRLHQRTTQRLPR